MPWQFVLHWQRLGRFILHRLAAAMHSYTALPCLRFHARSHIAYAKSTVPPPCQPYLQPFAAGPPQPTALGRAAAAGDLAVVTSNIFAAEAAAAGMTPDQYLAYQEDQVMQEVLAVRLLRCGQVLHFWQGALVGCHALLPASTCSSVHALRGISVVGACWSLLIQLASSGDIRRPRLSYNQCPLKVQPLPLLPHAVECG